MKRRKRRPSSGDAGEPRYLARDAVARLFGVSAGTVAAWAREGKLAYLSTLGGHRRYRLEDVLALLTERRGGPDRRERQTLARGKGGDRGVGRGD